MPDFLLNIPWVREGGVVMLVLYGVSLVGLSLILERMVALRQRATVPRDWLAYVREVVVDEGIEGLGEPAVWPRSTAAAALGHLVAIRELVPAVDVELVDQAVTRQEDRLLRGIAGLGMLAALAPLLGLLGTVAGMIETFRMIAAGGIGDPKALAGGIYQALYTTAGGLTIAIPLTVAYRLLRRRAERLATELEAFLVEIVHIDRNRGGRAQ